MKKFNLQELSHQDRQRVHQFCRIIAIGWLRLEEKEAREAAEANKKCEKTSEEVDLMTNLTELQEQISNGEKTLNQAGEELGIEPIEDEGCNEFITKFSEKTIDGLIPENILAMVRNTYSRFEVEVLDDGTVVIRVPKDEEDAIRKFRDSVHNLLMEMRKENSVLAGKLARQHRF